MGVPWIDVGYAAKVKDDVDIVFWETGALFGGVDIECAIPLQTVETFFDAGWISLCL